MEKGELTLKKKEQKQIKLTEDLNKLKISYKEISLEKQEASEDIKKINDKLLTNNKRLLKQKNELIQAYKKQQKLIELLKK